MSKTVRVRIAKQAWDAHLRKSYTVPEHVLVHDPVESLLAGDVIRFRSGYRTSSTVHHIVTKIITPFGKGIDERPPVPSAEEISEQKLNFAVAKVIRQAVGTVAQRVKDETELERAASLAKMRRPVKKMMKICMNKLAQLEVQKDFLQKAVMRTAASNMRDLEADIKRLDREEIATLAIARHGRPRQRRESVRALQKKLYQADLLRWVAQQQAKGEWQGPWNPVVQESLAEAEAEAQRIRAALETTGAQAALEKLDWYEQGRWAAAAAQRGLGESVYDLKSKLHSAHWLSRDALPEPSTPATAKGDQRGRSERAVKAKAEALAIKALLKQATDAHFAQVKKKQEDATTDPAAAQQQQEDSSPTATTDDSLLKGNAEATSSQLSSTSASAPSATATEKPAPSPAQADSVPDIPEKEPVSASPQAPATEAKEQSRTRDILESAEENKDGEEDKKKNGWFW